MSEQPAFYTVGPTMTAEERRAAIRGLLTERRQQEPPQGVTTSELADLFNVSQRQIQLDLQKLSTEPDYVPMVLDIRYEWRLI